MSPNKTILLVDDEADIRQATQLWMATAGFKTSTAKDGEQAVACATQQQPDAIVMDVRMPHLDGLSALAELKEQTSTQHIPVVMLSASLVDQERALDAGANCFVTKPYDGRNLIKVVQAAIGTADLITPSE
ncbi:Alkaline phosphatase synthesis transcriptional regulatory protein PhoP [Symmachiella dynata]|uniref:response regulator n=1 Tax=Symmachiella dynata TaxID=2527995 RepID=UPI00118C9C7E|nr:response regulator [Symmachiella dynata]QDT47414.1 Alkaline phosphatase synthesis transcriptional regulatory protein PhoP [Symmachiella dynata]